MSLGAAAALLALTACGFAPAYAPGTTGDLLRGRVAVEAPDTPDGYRLRARLEDRLGLTEAPSAVPRARLAVALEVEEVAAGLAADGTIARYDLVGRAAWRLAGAGGDALAEGVADGFTGYSATGSTVATRAAATDARERLAVLLADEVAGRLLLLPPSTVTRLAVAP